MNIPSVPLTWPYAPRIVLDNLTCHQNIQLPGLTGLWQLETIPNCTIPKDKKNLEQCFGRGGVFQAGSIVIRPYRRGGLIRYFNKNNYFSTKRFKQEFDLHRAIWQSGLPTVEPIGWGYKRKLCGYEGVFLSRFTQSTPWPNTWQCDHSFLKQLQTIIKALCSWQLYAPDLNATNILIDLQGSVIALDWDRTSWSNKANMMHYYQNRLMRSMKKLNAQSDVLAKVQKCLNDS